MPSGRLCSIAYPRRTGPNMASRLCSWDNYFVKSLSCPDQLLQPRRILLLAGLTFGWTSVMRAAPNSYPSGMPAASMPVDFDRTPGIAVITDRVDVPVRATRSTLMLLLPPEPAPRYLTLEFWLAPRLVQAWLDGPDGRRIDLMPLLRRLPAEQSAHPDRGSFHVLGDIVRAPAAGTWRLVLDHAPAPQGGGVWLQAVLQPRYGVHLETIGGSPLRSDVDVDVRVTLTNYGVPDAAAQPGLLRVQEPGGRSFEVELRPLGGAGRHEARIELSSPGSLTLAAEATWPATGMRAAARTKLTVAAGAPGKVPGGTLTIDVRPEWGPGRCLRSLVFSIEWAAPAPGVYVLALAFRDRQGRDWRVSGSTQVATAGPVVLEALARSTQLSQWPSGPLREAVSVEVVQASGDSPVLLRRADVALRQPFDPPATCR